MIGGIFQQLVLIDMDENYKIKVTLSEYAVVKEVCSGRTDFFKSENINESEYVLTFRNIGKFEELDEMIKDKLIYKGFDFNYEPNFFGRNCENLVDKFYKILK